MGRLTPPGKCFKSKPRRKALKCTVELTLHAITCPGVLLPSPKDVYVRVRMMGQYKKTKCVSPAFPLLLHESMVFTKMFSEAFDPGDVADHLENDTTCLEIIQLVSPGKILATFEENTRDFLYPSLRLIPEPRCLDREVLMTKSALFPGIFPKVEFSTMSVIEECDLRASQPAVSPPKTLTSKTCPVSLRNPRPTATESCGYQRPTIASQSHCSSPYTHRRMCQLTDDAKQRLRYLQLGPYNFKKDTAYQPPFVVPCSSNSSLIESSTTSSALQLSPKGESFNRTNIKGHSVSPEGKSSSFLASLSPGRNRAYQSTPVSGSLRERCPLLNRTTLRERFQSPKSPSEEIHERVEKLLLSVSAPYNLTFEDLDPRSSSHEAVLHEDRIIPGAPSVRLDNGTFWTNKVAKYTGKSHRAVFEDSLGKIYKNLYRKASSPTYCDSQSN